MARIRSIKPEFWTEPDIVAMPMEARLFLIGCWNHADDFGVLRDDAEGLRLKIMPADDIDAPAIIDELVDRRHLVRMVAPDGTKVLVVRTFCVHQRIDRRAIGRWGKPDDFETPPIPTNPAQSRADSRNPAQSRAIPSNPAPGREGKGLYKTTVDETSTAPEPVRTVFDAWIDSTGRQKARTKLSSDRRRCIARALKNYPVDELLEAVDGWRFVAHNRGENDRQEIYNDIELLLRDSKHIEKFRDAKRGDRHLKAVAGDNVQNYVER